MKGAISLKRILVDAEKCSGCRFCQMLCSFRHEGKFSTQLSRITVMKEDKYGFDYPVLCHQCEHCFAVAACPTGALTQTESGVVNLNSETCAGCGLCLNACPFKAVKLDESSKPLLCDLCGGKPLCVERCPTKALSLGDAAAEDPEKAFVKLLRRWGIGG